MTTPRLTDEVSSPGGINSLRLSPSLAFLPNQLSTRDLFAEHWVGCPWNFFQSSIFIPALSTQGAISPPHVQGPNQLATGNIRPAILDFFRSITSYPSNSVNTSDPVSMFKQYLPLCFALDKSQNLDLLPAFPDDSYISQLVGMSFGMVANRALSAEVVQQFLNMIMGYAPRGLLRRLLNNGSPTSCAAVEYLLLCVVCLGDEEGLNFLLEIGISKDQLSGAKGGRLLGHANDNGYTEMAKRLVLAGADPNYGLYDNHFQPLLSAVGSDDLDFVKILLKAGAEVNPPDTTTWGTPLSLAVENDCAPCVSILLDGGAEVDRGTIYYDEGWWDVTRTFLRLPILDYAFLMDFTDIYHLLLAKSSKAKNHLTISGIIHAARSGPQQLGTYLEQRAGDDDETRTALLEKALSHVIHHDTQDEAIEVLLDFNVDPNAPTMTKRGQNYLPLCQAIPDNDLVERLIDAGADINRPEVMLCVTGEAGDINCLAFLITCGLDLKTLGSIGLGQAINALNMDIVKLLLYEGAPATGSDIMGRCLIVSAIDSHSEEAFQLLLKHGADVNGMGRDGSRPIHKAAYHKSSRMARLLVDNGALLDHTGLRGARYGTVLEECIHGEQKVKRSETFTYLLEQGAPVNAPEAQAPLRRNSLLTMLILKSAEEDLISEVLEKGARVDEKRLPHISGARTPIQAAAEMGNLDLLKKLHKGGADINAPAGHKLGRTALQAACSAERANLEVVTYLLNNEANINAKAGFDGGLTAIQGAAIRGNIEIVSELLGRDADLNADPAPMNGRTALDGAAEHGRLNMVYMLLKAGAKCKWEGMSGYDSAIEFAEKRGHLQVAKILRDAGGENIV